MDIVGMVIGTGQVPPIGMHIEWWCGFLQYSSFTTQLFWVFHQALPAWLVTLLLLNESKKKNIIALYALCIPYAPFPTIGLFPFVLYFLFKRNSKEKYTDDIENHTLAKKIISSLRNSISFHSIVISGIIIIVFGSYFAMNHGTQSSNGFIFSGNIISIAFYYSIFCLIEFGAICIFIFPKFKKESLFIVTLLVLLAVPTYKSGFSNDFCMRVSIPALLILCVFSIEYISREKNKLRLFLFVGVLTLGAVTPFYEGARAIINIINKEELIQDPIKSFSPESSRETDELSVHIKNFLSEKNPDGFFTRYLQKKE
jgi:hypothetical protein